MSQNILFLAHVDEVGTALPKAAYEALGAALELAQQPGGTLTIGLVGEDVEAAAGTIAATRARILGVSGPDFAHPRYASDAAAVEAICRAVSPQVVVAAATSRFLRVVPGVSQRLQGSVDTHLTSIELLDGVLTAKRWLYRQRLEATRQREARPWFVMLDSGCRPAWTGTPAPAEVVRVDLQLPSAAQRTTFAGVRVPNSTAQTIR